MAFWRRKKQRPAYYAQPRQWYRRPRRAVPIRLSRKPWLAKAVHRMLERLFSNFLYRTIAGIAVLLALLFILLTSSLSIETIDVVRENLQIDSAKVENSLNSYLGKSILLARKKGVARRIIGHFPEFRSVRVKKILPDRLQIILDAHPFVANLKAYYTESTGPKLSSHQFSALNQAIQELARQEDRRPDPLALIEAATGAPASETLQQAPAGAEAEQAARQEVEQKGLINAVGQAIFDQEENLALRTIAIRGLGRAIADREQVIRSEHMSYILEGLTYFQTAMNLTVKDVTYFPVGRELHLKTEDDLFVWLTLELPYRDQIDKLRAIYENAELNTQELVYIDLRVREKVIYCPRAAPCRRLADEY